MAAGCGLPTEGGTHLGVLHCECVLCGGRVCGVMPQGGGGAHCECVLRGGQCDHMFVVMLTGWVGRCLFAATDHGWMVCCVACYVKRK